MFWKPIYNYESIFIYLNLQNTSENNHVGSTFEYIKLIKS